MNQIVHQFDQDPAAQVGHLRIIGARLWRRRMLFGLIFALFLVPALAAFLIWPAQYQTTGMVIVGNLDPFSSASAAGTDKLGDPADLESQILIAKSPRMMRLALERPGVAAAIQEECQRGGLLSYLRHRDCSVLKPGSEAMLNYVAPRYTVRAEGRSRVISMGFRSSSPDVAFILANALIVTYLEDQRAENGPAREEAAKWILAPAPKVESSGNGDIAKKEAFYRNLHSKATDFETERRSLPNPSRLVSFAEMPADAASKLPVLVMGLAIAAILAGLVVISLADKLIGLFYLVLPGRWALWFSA
jgi:polysaccharide biosynthesis transport protein